MRKTKAEKIIEKEEKHREKERRKQIELANKMLIPVPKVTSASLGLLSFDPKGVFRFSQNRWVKIFRLQETLQNEEMHLIELVKKLHAKVRITKKIHEKETQNFLTLTLSGEIYDEVRTRILEDETLMRHFKLLPLDVDAVMKEISKSGKQRDFSYASMVRGKMDWEKECYPLIDEKEQYFVNGGLYGECSFVLQYPKQSFIDVFSQLKEIGCPVWSAFDLQGIKEEDQNDFIRALEQKYNRRLGNGGAKEFMNTSLQILFFCDSDDARKIIEKTVFTIFSNAGFVLAPAIGAQKVSAESILSFGLTERTSMRNVEKEVVESIQM